MEAYRAFIPLVYGGNPSLSGVSLRLKFRGSEAIPGFCPWMLFLWIPPNFAKQGSFAISNIDLQIQKG